MVEIKKPNEVLVVNELPKSPIRAYEGEDGKVYDLITTNEAIKEILEGVRAIRRGTVGN